MNFVQVSFRVGQEAARERFRKNRVLIIVSGLIIVGSLQVVDVLPKYSTSGAVIAILGIAVLTSLSWLLRRHHR